MGRRTKRAGFALVAVENGFAFALVLGGWVMVGSLLKVVEQPLGIDADRLAVFELNLRDVPADTRAQRVSEVLERLSLDSATPAAVMDALFMDRALTGSSFRLPSGSSPRGITQDVAVSEAFFEVLGIQPVEGELPTPADLRSGVDVGVVSDTVAKGYWPNKPAIGEVLQSRNGSLRIVGVVPSLRLAAPDLPAQGEIYHSVHFGSGRVLGSRVNLFVRSPLPVEEVGRRVQKTVGFVGGGLAFQRANSVSQRIWDSISIRRLSAWLLGSFAFTGLLVAVAGSFGLADANAAERVREVGVRMALGATRWNVVRLLLMDHLRPTVVGIAFGAVGAWFASGASSALLFGIDGLEPGWWISTAVLIIVSTTLAVLVPVLRVTRAQPMDALAAE